MDLIHPFVDAYATAFASKDSELLQRIAQQTQDVHAQHAHMLSGLVQGRVLSFLSQMIQPRTILEIGTFTGYSALCLAEGLQEKGELHTIESRTEDANIASKNFEQSAYKDAIFVHIGEAQQIIPQLNNKWDLIFIDADKTACITYYEMLLPQLNDNGWIIVDNLLFHGKIFDYPKQKNAQAMLAFGAHVKKDARVEQVLLTIRDGLLLIKKRKVEKK